MVIEIINLVFVFVFCMNYFSVSLKVMLDLMKNIVSTQILILVTQPKECSCLITIYFGGNDEYKMQLFSTFSEELKRYFQILTLSS